MNIKTDRQECDCERINKKEYITTQWLILISVCTALFIMPMSMSSLNIALPAIAAEFKASASIISLIPTVSLISAISLQLPAGRLADVFGRKKLFMAGIAIFILSSSCILFSSTALEVLIIRLTQGFSSALIFGTGMAIVSHTFHDGNRGLALGFTATSIYLGLTCGPLIGGFLTDTWGWRSVIFSPVPFAIMCFVLIKFNIEDLKPENKSAIDIKGSILFMASTFTFFIGLTQASEQNGLYLLSLGIILFSLFFIQQKKSNIPLIRIRKVIENRVFYRSIKSSLLMFASNYPLQFMLSLYLQYVHNLTATETGAILLIQAVTLAVASPIAGRVSDHFNSAIPSVLGCLVFSIGFIMLTTLDNNTQEYIIISVLIFMGLGFSFFASPTNNSALGSVPKDRLDMASSLLNISRSLGNIIGMAIVALIFKYIIGDSPINPNNFDKLIVSINISFVVCFVFSFAAAWIIWTARNKKQ